MLDLIKYLSDPTGMTAAGQQRIAAVRRFNRFYTRQIGVLRKTYLGSSYSLGELRVLHEIAQADKLGDQLTASDIGRALDLDAGYLSRVLRNFEKLGLITRKTSLQDARQSYLALTAHGAKTFTPLEQRSQRQVAAMLGQLSSPQRARLVAAMNLIETLLGGKTPAQAAAKPRLILRQPRPGELGWVVARHGALYAQEQGWHVEHEGLVAEIVAKFLANHDPRRERGLIADIDGEPVGSVFLIAQSKTVARLRLLLIEPQARGLGIGQRMVDECIRFARRSGYRKIVLSTYSVLAAARHIYEKTGFTLTRSEKHKSWGKPLVSEHWELTL